MPDPIQPAPTDRKADAVRVPLKFAPTPKLWAEVGALLGLAKGTPFYIRNQGAERYCSASPHDTLLYPDGHERARQERYDWTDRGDGMLLGTLKAEAKDAD